MIILVTASLAQFESALISQRLKAGMARAKAQGILISLPKLSIQKQQKLFELQKMGLSKNKISKKAKVAYGTVYNYLGNKSS